MQIGERNGTRVVHKSIVSQMVILFTAEYLQCSTVLTTVAVDELYIALWYMGIWKGLRWMEPWRGSMCLWLEHGILSLVAVEEEVMRDLAKVAIPSTVT